MNINYIQDIWKQHETALIESRELNITLLKEIKIDKAKSSLRRLLYLPISSTVFYSFVLVASLGFIIDNWSVWHLALSGTVISLFSFSFIVLSIKQLWQILSIDYDTRIVTLQKNISLIKSSVIDNLRLANWIIPCFPFVTIFLFKVLWDVDIVANLSHQMLYVYGAIIVLLVVVSTVISLLLKPQNSNKKWMRWLLQGSGSQVDEAVAFLEEVRAFEKK